MVAVCCVSFGLASAVPALAQEGPVTADTATAQPVLDTGLRLVDQAVPESQHPPGKPAPSFPGLPRTRGNIDYAGLLADSFTMATIQHTFRIATEARTRQALKGPFWDDYVEAISTWRGWGDDDTVRVNYFGHPAMGSFSAFIFANNDLVSRSTSFGQPGYGRAKWRQFLFANVYSLQFELGPYSEASIGNVDQALIDHLLTPTVGIAWSTVEDVIDVKLLAKLRRNHKNWANALAPFITPTRSLSNIAAFKVPWYRERPIVD
jgi:hypothetical protein